VTETVSWQPDGEPASSYDLETTAFPLELVFGGTLGAGFVLGGSLTSLALTQARRPDLPMPASERDDEHTAILSALGLHADWYPDPTGGFHLQGMVGAGTLLLGDTADSDYAPAGSVMAGGAGYEWWLDPDTSLGIALRADLAALEYEDGDTGIVYEHESLHVGLMATATYH